MRKRENALQMQDAAKMGTTPNDNQKASNLKKKPLERDTSTYVVRIDNDCDTDFVILFSFLNKRQ